MIPIVSHLEGGKRAACVRFWATPYCGCLQISVFHSSTGGFRGDAEVWGDNVKLLGVRCAPKMHATPEEAMTAIRLAASH